MIHMLAHNARNSFKDRDMQINLDNKPIRLSDDIFHWGPSPASPRLNELFTGAEFNPGGGRQLYRDTL